MWVPLEGLRELNLEDNNIQPSNKMTLEFADKTITYKGHSAELVFQKSSKKGTFPVRLTNYVRAPEKLLEKTRAVNLDRKTELPEKEKFNLTWFAGYFAGLAENTPKGDFRKPLLEAMAFACTRVKLGIPE